MAFSDFWKRIVSSPAFLPTRILIAPQKTDKAAQFTNSFSPATHYFTVRINEMFLSYSRKWFATYDPIVFCVSEFVYDNKRAVVPFVVGPSLLQDKISKLPEGMIFQNTTVAGAHPYQGGPMTFSIVLARMQQKNYLQNLLKVIEGVASTYTGGFATMVNDYLKVANTVLAGVESLFGVQETEALVGLRREFNPDAGDVFRPGYFVLVNRQQNELDESKFWVKNDTLCYGDSLASARPYREDDYVLYSIVSSDKRTDIDLLPFSAQWKKIKDAANALPSISEEQWSIIKSDMYALRAAIMGSTDLIPAQATTLADFYKESILDIKNGKTWLGVAAKSLSTEEQATLDYIQM